MQERAAERQEKEKMEKFDAAGIERFIEMAPGEENLSQHSMEECFLGNLSYTSQSSFKGYDSNVFNNDPWTVCDGFQFHNASRGNAFNLMIPLSCVPNDGGQEYDYGSRQQSFFSSSALSDASAMCSKPHILHQDSSSLKFDANQDKNNGLSDIAGKTGSCFTFNLCDKANDEAIFCDPEKNTKVFVFGASQEVENDKAVPFKENCTNFPVSRPSLRSQMSRAKKNSYPRKGKGLPTLNSRTIGKSSECAESSFFTNSYPENSFSAMSFDNVNYSVSSVDQSEVSQHKATNVGNKHGYTMDSNFCFSTASNTIVSELESLAAIDKQFNQWHPFVASFEDIISKAGTHAQDTGASKSTTANELFEGISEEHIVDHLIGHAKGVNEKFVSGICKNSNQAPQYPEGNRRFTFDTKNADNPIQESLKQVNQGQTSTIFYSKFPRPDDFRGNVDKLEKNEEASCNHSSIKEIKEPFVFRSSELKSNLVSDVAGAELSTTFDSCIPAKDSPMFIPGITSKNGAFAKASVSDFCMPKSSSEFYFVQGSAGCCQTSSSIPSFKLGVCYESNQLDCKNTSSNFGSARQPFFPSSTSRGISYMNANEYLEPVVNSQASADHDEGPIAEFSCPPSSSDSSASESPHKKHEENLQRADVFLSPFCLFEFRGSNKGAKYKPQRMKDKRLSSKHKKQIRYSLHNENKLKSSYEGFQVFNGSAEGGESPMDFSPCFEAEHFVASPEHSIQHSDASFSNGEQYSVFQKSVGEKPRGNNSGRVEETHICNASCGGSNKQDFWWAGTDGCISEGRVQKVATCLEEHNKFSELEGSMKSFGKETCRSDNDLVDELSDDDYSSNRRKHLRFMSGSSQKQFSRRHAERIQYANAPNFNKNLVVNVQEAFGIKESGNIPDAANLKNNNVIDMPYEENECCIPGQTVQTDKTLQESSCDASSADASAQAQKSGDACAQPQKSGGGEPATSLMVKSIAAAQLCEQWRLRGNQAYADGDFSKAEECYSRGASSVSPNETSERCMRASMLCYSNRAATRMAVGRIKEALADCARAIEVDPRFLRVRMRAAGCHLALGESKAAASLFNESLNLSTETDKLDTKAAAEIAEGLKKIQQLDEYSDQAATLLQSESTADVTAALHLLNEALTISPYAEYLLEAKAEALISLRRYEEAIQLCEQTLSTAEQNHSSVIHELFVHVLDSSCNETCVGNGATSVKLWRWRKTAKALFHMGKLEEALDLIEKHEKSLTTLCDKCIDMKISTSESLVAFAANIRDLLRHKTSGNEAFQASRHVEAIEHYSAALAYSGESRSFNAVCFCNRAAASQALGHISDAIADCSRAIALDPNYPKAISRRATLYEIVRNYGQACHDLRRLINLYERFQQGKNDHQTGAQNIAARKLVDLCQARDRLAKAEEEIKKAHPLDHYLILGVEPLCSASEIKKAYRKAALRHHPDKASQCLVRGETGDEGNLWKEIGDDVRNDAELLFKMIGESYAILSDAAKRLRYDTDEELRKLRTNSSADATLGRPEPYRSQYEKCRRQHERWDSWNGYAQKHQRWQSGPDAAQPDAYRQKGSYMANASKFGRDSWEV